MLYLWVKPLRVSYILCQLIQIDVGGSCPRTYDCRFLAQEWLPGRVSSCEFGHKSNQNMGTHSHDVHATITPRDIVS